MDEKEMNKDGPEVTDEYSAMLAVMEWVDPATVPGLTAKQRAALGRFAKPHSFSTQPAPKPAKDSNVAKPVTEDGSEVEARIAELENALEGARQVLAKLLSAGHNLPSATPEEIDAAFWSVDAALEQSNGL